MTCAECLSAVLVADQREMDPASAVGRHCETCAECTRVVTQVRERERSVASALEGVQMSALPSVVAREALVASRRRIARRWRMVLIAALGVTASFGIVREVLPRLRDGGRLGASDPVVTVTLQLKCITSSQASDLATPYLRSKGPAVYQARDLSAVTLRGASIEVEQARRAIEEFDVRCMLPNTTGVPAPDIPPR
ncbi:MAG: hypothetical protein M3O61_01020 [Gemmatimonadota bacterium]|nr:hypothetical protein [Gemmatimonadota bacterium]